MNTDSFTHLVLTQSSSFEVNPCKIKKLFSPKKIEASSKQGVSLTCMQNIVFKNEKEFETIWTYCRDVGIEFEIENTAIPIM